jgi:hypothetical protein
VRAHLHIAAAWSRTDIEVAPMAPAPASIPSPRVLVAEAAVLTLVALGGTTGFGATGDYLSSSKQCLLIPAVARLSVESSVLVRRAAPCE